MSPQPAIFSPSSATSRIGFAARYAALRVLDPTSGRGEWLVKGFKGER